MQSGLGSMKGRVMPTVKSSGRVISVPTTTGLSVSDIKDRMKAAASNGGDRTLLLISDGDEATMRFVTEIDKWVFFNEHWTQASGFIPCIGSDEGCTFCDEGLSPSYRALAVVYVYEVKRAAKKGRKESLQDMKKVMLLKMNNALQTAITSRSERRGTITDRDVVIIREGAGAQDTTYLPEWSDQKSEGPKISRKDIIDPLDTLTKTAESYYGASKKTRNKVVEEDEDEVEEDVDIDEDEEFEKIVSKRKKSRR